MPMNLKCIAQHPNRYGGYCKNNTENRLLYYVLIWRTNILFSFLSIGKPIILFQFFLAARRFCTYQDQLVFSLLIGMPFGIFRLESSLQIHMELTGMFMHWSVKNTGWPNLVSLWQKLNCIEGIKCSVLLSNSDSGRGFEGKQ